jgi:hypothetical protein
MPNAMRNVVSMGGRTFGDKNAMSWCLPGSESPGMPICVLVMSSSGPSFLPTSVGVPVGTELPHGDYKEIEPSISDLDIMESIFDWQIADGNEDNEDDLYAAVKQAHNFGAANHFLTTEHVGFHNALNPVHELIFGQLVRAHVIGEVAPVEGRLLSHSAPFIVISQQGDRFRKFVVPECSLFV